MSKPISVEEMIAELDEWLRDWTKPRPIRDRLAKWLLNRIARRRSNDWLKRSKSLRKNERRQR